MEPESKKPINFSFVFLLLFICFVFPFYFLFFSQIQGKRGSGSKVFQQRLFVCDTIYLLRLASLPKQAHGGTTSQRDSLLRASTETGRDGLQLLPLSARRPGEPKKVQLGQQQQEPFEKPSLFS